MDTPDGSQPRRRGGGSAAESDREVADSDREVADEDAAAAAVS
jgi:hypothetical protein